MPSYSVSLNAVVSPTGGSIARLDAVCAAGPATNMVVVANAANLAVAGGKFRGVALEAAAGNQSIQIVDFGTVDLLGATLGGTGDYVSVNATGQLERTSGITSATIGTLENGTIHVNVSVGIGGFSGNATAIQGVAVGSAVATASYEMRGDGSAIRMAPSKSLKAYDYRVGGVLTAASWAALIADVPACGEIELYAGDHTVTTPIQLRDDTPGGGKHSVRIVGPGGNALRRAGGARLLHGVTEPSTTVGTYISHGAAGTQQMLRMGGWTGLDATLHTGRLVFVWNSANTGFGIVAKVHSATTATIYFPKFAAVNDATKSGSIKAKILMPVMDVMARATVLDGVTFVAPAGVNCGMLLNVQNPPGASASLVTKPEFYGPRFEITATSSAMIAMAIGMPYVPESGSTYYSATMQDGTDTNIPRVADTAAFGNGNCSEGVIQDFYAPYAGWYAQILHGSPSGQSVVWEAKGMAFQPVITGYLIPAGMAAGAQMDFDGITGSACEDFIIRTNKNNRPRTYTRAYIEADAAFLYDGAEGNTGQVTTIVSPYLRCTTPHPSGAMIRQLSQGPMTIVGGQIGCASDTTLQIRNEGGNTGEASAITLLGVQLQGAPTFTSGQPARGCNTTTVKQAFDMSGDVWELDLEEDPLSGGAHIRTFAFSSANLTAAGCFTYPWPNTGITQVWLAQVAKCIRYLATLNGWGITAWADIDQTQLWFASTTLGASSRIRVTAHARASRVDASVQFGIVTTGTFAGVAANPIATETSGWVESINSLTSPGTVAAAKLTVKGCNFYNTAGTQQAFPDVDGKYYGTVTNKGAAVMSNRFSPPGGTFTMAAAATKDVAETRATAGSVVRLMPTNAAAATLMAGASSLYQVVASTVVGTSFRVATADGVAAAGTETFSYTIEEPWT